MAAERFPSDDSANRLHCYLGIGQAKVRVYGTTIRFHLFVAD